MKAYSCGKGDHILEFKENQKRQEPTNGKKSRSHPNYRRLDQGHKRSDMRLIPRKKEEALWRNGLRIANNVGVMRAGGGRYLGR